MKNIDKVFTLSGLRDYLNKNFKQKKSGTSFNLTDVQQYISRGFLPIYLGGNLLEEVKEKNIVSSARYYKIKSDKMTWKKIYGGLVRNKK